MAELLVRAQAHWMDSLKQEDIDKMTPEQKQSYEARSQVGDIIVVRPDGWQWGKCECLPDYVVIKRPDLKIEDAKVYEEQLTAKKDVVRTMEIAKAQYDSAADKSSMFAISSSAVKVAPTIKETKTNTYVVEATIEESYCKRVRKHQVDAAVVTDAVKSEKSIIEADEKLTITVKE